MSYRHNYTKGDWKAICDSCGRIFKASQIKKRWDGLMVCPSDFEVRHPQDFVRGVADTQVVPWTRPQNQDTFIYSGSSSTIVVGTLGSSIMNTTLIG